jgi:ADP-ribosylglycohydrolase
LPFGGDLPGKLANLMSSDVTSLTPGELADMNGSDSFIVYNTLPLAYACFLRHPTSVEALYDAVAAGGDTDTNASIAGSLVGALNGTAVFPAHLIEGLRMRERIMDTAERLCERLGIKE